MALIMCLGQLTRWLQLSQSKMSDWGLCWRRATDCSVFAAIVMGWALRQVPQGPDDGMLGAGCECYPLRVLTAAALWGL